jgi:hypothetical protein
MRRHSIFWGIALILAGVLLWLQVEGYINNVFQFFWPITLILVGGWIILNVFWKPDLADSETFSVALGAAKSAQVRFSHGAGQISIHGGAAPGVALLGSSAVGMNHHDHMNGDRLDVHVEAGPSFLPFLGPTEGIWRFQLTREIPLDLIVEAGASQIDVELTDLLVPRMQLKTGASSTNVTMPAHGASVLDVEAGVASINIRVPGNVPARIRAEQGVSSINVDTNRFPRSASGFYQSPDFDTSADRVEINIQAGVGSISVK